MGRRMGTTQLRRQSLVIPQIPSQMTRVMKMGQILEA
jgi:hypothetical protein